MAPSVVPEVGTSCKPDQRNTTVLGAHSHLIEHPDDDQELQTVLAGLRKINGLEERLAEAITNAVDYVLDGGYTGRFSIMELDRDEKTLIGTKVQYRLLEALGLPRIRPLDTVVAGVPIDIKNTVRDNWMIPIEGQCQICLLTQIDQANDRFAARLIRAHRLFLSGGPDSTGNGDKKRSFLKPSLEEYAVPVLDELWAHLPRNPLRDLTAAQRNIVFQPNNGFKSRTVQLFSFMPNVIIPRRSLETVGTKLRDPMRRVRETRPLLRQHGLHLLSGKWLPERELARAAGFTLGEDDWVAIPVTTPPQEVPAVLLPPEPADPQQPPSLPEPS